MEGPELEGHRGISDVPWTRPEGPGVAERRRKSRLAHFGPDLNPANVYRNDLNRDSIRWQQIDDAPQTQDRLVRVTRRTKFDSNDLERGLRHLPPKGRIVAVEDAGPGGLEFAQKEQ